MSSSALHGWVKKYAKVDKNVSVSSGHHFDAIKRLNKELAKVIQKRDLLRKAATYFAKGTL